MKNSHKLFLVLTGISFFHISFLFADEIAPILQTDQTSSMNEPSSIPAIYNQLKNADPATKKTAIATLAGTSPTNPADIDLLLATYKAGGPLLQNAVLQSLNNISPQSFHLRSSYIRLLDVKDKKIQLAATAACVRLKAKEAAPKILSMLKKQSDYKIRLRNMAGATEESMGYAHAAAQALIDLDYFPAIDEIMNRDIIMMINPQMVSGYGAKALPKLISLAKSKSHLKQGGYTAIAWMRDENATSQLISLLKDKDEKIASAAARALIEIGAKSETKKGEIESAFKEQIGHKDRFVRAQAYAGLIVINPKKNLPVATSALKKDPEVRLEILYAMWRKPASEMVVPLKEFINWDESQRPNDPNLRAVAAQIIFKTTNERVPYKGLEIEKKRHKDPYDPGKF